MADYPQIPKMRKLSRGRQKIEIKKIEQTNSRQVAFSKRKSGLFKKAGELAVLCGAEVSIIAMSERERPFSFGHPNAEVVLDRFLSDGNYVKKDSIASSHTRLRELNEQYEEAVKELEEEKIKEQMVERGGEIFGDFFLWDLPVENMAVDELEHYMESLYELKHNVVARMNQFNYYSFNSPPLAALEPMSGDNNLTPIMDSAPPDFGGNARV